MARARSLIGRDRTHAMYHALQAGSAGKEQNGVICMVICTVDCTVIV